MRLVTSFLVVLACLLFVGVAGATDHFAAPTGSPTGDGTIARPWDLDTALGSPSGSQSSSVKPGDTIWLRGGIYIPATDNGYISHVTGTPSSPIIVRNYNGERATLQAGTNAYVLAIYGSDTWYWGLEGATAGVSRTANQPGSFNNPLAFGFAIYGPDIKIINCVVHDTAQGFSGYNSSPNAEIYGNLSYYNGWMAPDRNHGHGIYLQNITGAKLVEDNFVGDNADEGIQAYGSSAATITGVTLQGNTLYNTSSWPAPHYQYNLVMGGGQLDSGNTITENMSFFTPAEDYGFFNIGQYTPGSNLTATNNVFVGGYIAVSVDGVAGPFVFTGNKVYNRPTSLREIELAPYSGQTMAGYKWDNNTYYGLNRFYHGTYDGSNAGGGSNLDLTGWQSQTGFDLHSTLNPSAPTGEWIYVRPNKYEAKRANITIYNWDLTSSVNVNLSGVLAVGDNFVIQDAQNFYGPPVVSGTYAGASVSIPMTGLSKATPSGFAAPAHTAPLLGTFIVMPPGAAIPILQPTPTPTPIPTPAPVPTGAIGVGSTVEVLPDLGSNINVRLAANTTLAPIASEVPTALGTVVGGPSIDKSTGFTMWQVTFADGISGWVVGYYIEVTTATLPPPAPTPVPTPTPTPVNVLTSVSKANWVLVYADSRETQCENGAAVNGFDGNSATIWHTQYCPAVAPLPHEIQIDMGTAYIIGGFRYLPRQDGGVNGRIGQYEFYATNDPSNWGTAISSGSFANDATEKQVLFTSGAYRYVRLRALSEANGGSRTSMAELSVLQSSASASSLSSIAVTPSNSTIAVGTSQQFTATGTYQNGSTQDITTQVTWSSSNPSVAITAGGMAIGQSIGSATIVAAQGSVTGSTPASVQSVAPVSLTAVSKMNWTLAYADSQETQCENGAAINSFDASAATIWHTQYCPGVAQLPHEIQIDMGTGNLITGFRYLTRQDGGVNGRIGQYEFYATNDPSNWGTPLATGSFANDATEKQVLFAPNTYRYIRLRALTEANGGPWTSMAELTVLQSSAGGQ